MKHDTFLRTAMLAVVAAGLVAGSGIGSASAAPTTGLTIDPVGYKIVDGQQDLTHPDGQQDLTHPIEKPDLTSDPGYNSTSPSDGNYRESRSVVGPDDRTQIQETTAAPYRKTGQITFEKDGKDYRCTGWLISPTAVVTAGHCLVGGSHNITFSPARNGDSDPFGSYQATEVWYDKKFAHRDPAHESEEDRGRDWGLIKIDQPVGSTVGWYGLEPVDETHLVGKTARKIGYPGDKPEGTMWQATGSIVKQTPRRLYDVADTTGGQSGSAVTTGSENIAQGIVTQSYPTVNGATALTAELFNTLSKLR